MNGLYDRANIFPFIIGWYNNKFLQKALELF
jgi:hypothetical protein